MLLVEAEKAVIGERVVGAKRTSEPITAFSAPRLAFVERDIVATELVAETKTLVDVADGKEILAAPAAATTIAAAGLGNEFRIAAHGFPSAAGIA